MQEGNIKIQGMIRIWKHWAPPRVKLFAWLAFKGRLWTADRRRRHGLEAHDLCWLCDQENETGDHILLTSKFGNESDLWVRFDKESVWWNEGYFQRYSAKRSAVGYLLRFGKETVGLILRDWTVTWLNQGRRMDG
jgi:hypothetical protein